MKSIQIQDKILSTIVKNTQFPLFQIGMAFKRLKSFDKLLEAIDTAKEKGWSLSRIVDIMELEEV